MGEMDVLYSEARALTQGLDTGASRRAEEARVQHLAAVSLAQLALLRRVTEFVPEAVRACAARGERHAVVLQFQGPDTFDGEFCYLYLLKGPRGGDPEITPLLVTLRDALKPFRVTHEWRDGTVANTLTVAW